MRALRLLFALASLLHFAGCTAAVSADGPAPANRDDAGGRSPCSHPGDAFEQALARRSSGGGFTARLVEVQPEPPAMGVNTWQIGLRDAADRPLAGATVVVTSFMPDHAHSGPSVDVSETGSGGYQAKMNIVLMSGLYDFRIALATNHDDSAAYEFCVH